MRRIAFYILSAVFIFTFLFVSEAIEDDAMVLYYSFDEGKGKDKAKSLFLQTTTGSAIASMVRGPMAEGLMNSSSIIVS